MKTPRRLEIAFIPVLLLAGFVFAEDLQPQKAPRTYLQAVKILREAFKAKQEILPLELPEKMGKKERGILLKLENDTRLAQKKESDEAPDAYATRVYDVAQRLSWNTKEAYIVYIKEHDKDNSLGHAVALGKKQKEKLAKGKKKGKKERVKMDKAALRTAEDIAGALRKSGEGADLPQDAKGQVTDQSKKLEDALAQNNLPGGKRMNLKVNEPGLPGAETYHALGDNTVAPAPGIFDRIGSMFFNDENHIKEDFRLATELADKIKLPRGYAGHNGGIMSQPPAAFIAWMRSDSRKLPNISYGILSEGTMGEYKPGFALGKGTLTMNYMIKDAAPQERAVIMFHELYHHWDKKIANNHYANVSYGGMIGAGTQWNHEVDATLLAGLAAQETLEDCFTALCNFLNGLPTTPQEVITLVRGGPS